MDAFQSALDFVKQNEKGFTDNPSDPGGATNYGISLRFLREIPSDRLRKYGFFTDAEALDVHDIRELSTSQVENIYRDEFWEPANISALATLSWLNLTNYLMDMCVHHGVHQAIKILQRAIWAYYLKREWGGLLDDGIIGVKVIDELQRVDEHMFLNLLACERAGFCRLVVAVNPREKEFLNGWINRCYRI